MPTDWAAKVRDAITNLEIKTSRVLEPDTALAIIDDVVSGKFAAAGLATIHGIPQDWIQPNPKSLQPPVWPAILLPEEVRSIAYWAPLRPCRR